MTTQEQFELDRQRRMIIQNSAKAVAIAKILGRELLAMLNNTVKYSDSHKIYFIKELRGVFRSNKYSFLSLKDSKDFTDALFIFLNTAFNGVEEKDGHLYTVDEDEMKNLVMTEVK